MRVECPTCRRWFDDEFRSWNCPHKRINPGLSVDLDPPEAVRSPWTPRRPDWRGRVLLTVGTAAAIMAAVVIFVLAWRRT